ncbi:SRPBCC domain-containing protein [Spongiivirga sp. MCCC 1A20706]|uniref:SRPBCC family protein n=1 Tax=Spongiivirga sp. MCCC 1A20706 TaxID=3160963 RepID=UPI003977CE36
MKDSLIKQQIIDHPIDVIWSAITNAEEISSWFLKTDFKPDVGYNYTFNSTGENCSPITGEIKQASPYTLVYTWIVVENPVETLVTWKLEDINGKTKLTLEHSGISSYESATAIEMFNSFNNGWDNCLNGLTEYLSTAINAK